MNYYDDIIEEINEMIANKNYMEALAALQHELKMPYIPKEVLEQLTKLYQEVTWALKDHSTHHGLSDEEIEVGLFKDPMTQIQSVYALSEKNLREYTELIQQYFKSTAHPHAQSILIDSLIRQEINETFEVEVLEQEISFNPRYIEVFEESDGFIMAYQQLQQYFENDQPSLFVMAKDTLIQESFLRLPMLFSEDESLLISDSIASYIVHLMMDEQGIQTFLDNNRIECQYLMKLISQKIDI